MMKSLKMMCTMYNSVIVIRRIVCTVKTLVLFIIVILSKNNSVPNNTYHICKYMKINVLLPKSIITFYVYHPYKEHGHCRFRITCASYLSRLRRTMKIVYKFCPPYIFHVCRDGTSSFKFLNIEGREMTSALFKCQVRFL